MEEKFDDLIGVKCYKPTRAALKRIAAVRGLDDTALMRAMGQALVEFATLYGDTAAITLGLTLGQNWLPAKATEDGWAVAETTTAPSHSSAPAADAVQTAKKHFAPPPPVPPGPPKSQPSAEEKHGKQSPGKSGPR